MKKGDIVTGVCSRVDFPNRGIVETDEGIVTVKNIIPGQYIRLMINKKRNGHAEGRLLEVIKKAPLEKAVLCSFFGVCGGCNYLSLPYEEQLKLKEEQIRRLLQNAVPEGNEDFSFEGIKGSPRPLQYRNKMELTFGDSVKDGPLTLGLHKRGSFHDILPVSECMIMDGDFRRIADYTVEFYRDKNIPYFRRMSHEGILRHLFLRKAFKTGELLIGLVTTSENGIDGKAEDANLCIDEYKDGLIKLLENGELTGTIAGILHIINNSLSDIVQSDDTRILYGRDYFHEELLGLKFRISTFSFFQTNSFSAEVLYGTVREFAEGALKNAPVIYDLYSGTGTISQILAKSAKKVIGVELIEEAVAAARENARLNGIDNVEFIAGDVLKVLENIEEKPDFIVLDPPRDGIHPKALPKILDYGAENIIYISCKPSSLARDIPLIYERGYRIKRAVCIDQFPQTVNCETVCLLSNRKADSHIKLSLDMDEYYDIIEKEQAENK